MHAFRWMMAAGLSTLSGVSFAEPATTTGTASAAPTLEAVPAPTAPNPRPMLLHFEAGEGCPTAEAFLAEFQQRTKAFVLTLGAAGAGNAIHVIVGTEPRRSFGRMEIFAGESIIASREVEAPTCTEVVSALGFVAALAVEGKSESAPSSPASSGSMLLRRPPFDAGRAASGSAWDRRFAAGAYGGAVAGVFPHIAPDISLLFDVRRVRSKDDLAQPDADGFAPSFRFSLRAARSQPFELDGSGQARFQRFSAALSGCPWWIGISGQWSLVPCATAEIGVLTSVLEDVAGPTATHASQWVSFGAQSWLRWVAMAPFFVEASVQAQMPLWRSEFFRTSGTDQPIYKVSPVCGTLGVGVGVEL